MTKERKETAFRNDEAFKLLSNSGESHRLSKQDQRNINAEINSWCVNGVARLLSDTTQLHGYPQRTDARGLYNAQIGQYARLHTDYVPW